MDRNVLLAISGLHMDAEQQDSSVETYVSAEYFRKQESHYVIYEEAQEGFEKSSKNRLKFRDNMLELTRQGLVQTHMIFEEGKKHMTRYVTPYGAMMLGIDTKLVQVSEQEHCISVVVEYTLEADGEQLSEAKIEIHVKEA